MLDHPTLEAEQTVVPQLPDVIDSSRLSDFRACRRKFYNSHILKRRPTGESIHLIAGGAFASALDAARRYAFTTLEYNQEQMLLEAFRAFSLKWIDGDGEPYLEDPSENKTFAATWDAVTTYLREFNPLSDPIQPLRNADHSPTVEFNFAIPLKILHPSGTPFVFSGRFDMLGSYQGHTVGVDEKTTSYIASNWSEQWRMRGQFIGYCWALQQLGFKCNSFFVRGIAIRKRDIGLVQAPLFFPQHLIDRWEDELYRTIHEILECWKDDRWSFNFADSCASYSGCRYIGPCTSNDPDKWLFSPSFTHNTWSPIHVEE